MKTILFLLRIFTLCGIILVIGLSIYFLRIDLLKSLVCFATGIAGVFTLADTVDN